jgi:hypothetical protein
MSSDLVLPKTTHRGHGSDVVLLGDAPQCYTCWQRDAHIQHPRVPDHDRLGLLGLEAMAQQCFVEARGTIMTSGLPLDPGDLGILTVVIEGLCHEARRSRGVGAVEASIGHEAPTASVRDEEQRSEAAHSDCARGLRVSAQLLVVGQQQLLGCHNHRPGR